MDIGRRLSPPIDGPYRIAVVMLSAVLLFGAQPPNPNSFINICGLVVWMLALQGLPPVRAFIVGGLCGTFYGYLNAFWAADALVAFGVRPHVALLATLLGAAYVKGLEMAIESAAIRWIVPEHSILRCLYAAAVVFVVETCVSSGSWTVPWGLVGHAHVDNVGVSQLAVSGGVPLVSAAAVALACAITVNSGPVRPVGHRAAFYGALAGWGLLSVAGLPLATAIRENGFDSKTESHFVIAIQPNISRTDRWMASRQSEILTRVTAQTRRAIEANGAAPALVVWPELVVTNPIDIDRELGQRILKTAKSINAPLLTGVAYSGSSGAIHTARYRNAAVLIDSNGTIKDSIDKSLAVPLVESASPSWPIALFARWVLNEIRTPAAVDLGPPGHELVGAMRIAPLLCYEALFPRFAAARRSDQTDFIAVLADNSWVASSRPGIQLAAYSRYRAIEQRLSLLRIAHTGTSMVVNPYGLIEEELPVQRPGALTYRFSRSLPATVWEKITIFLLYFGPIAVLMKIR